MAETIDLNGGNLTFTGSRTLANLVVDVAGDASIGSQTGTLTLAPSVTIVATGTDNNTSIGPYEIVGLIGEINGVVARIASGAQSQAAGLSEVNNAVGELDRMTQENAAMVEQSTAAARNLEGETKRLADLVKQFRVGASAPAARRRAA